MKNIVRWTIGNCSEEGVECLRESICKFIEIYNDQFDYFICYNNIEKEKLVWSKKINIKLIDQKKYANSLKIKPYDKNPCWKLYPPRLRINSYEIFIDNDLIIYKKINLDEFIKSNIFFITQALKKNYGSLENFVKNKYNLNTGFFGIPKNFDLKKQINKIIKKYELNWDTSHFEEQGVISYIISNNKHEIINLEKIYVSFEDYQLAKNGFHFVGLNTDIKKFWYLHNTKFM